MNGYDFIDLTYEEMIDLDGGSFWGAVGGILDCIAGLAIGAGGVLLCLVPEPTMTTKYGSTVEKAEEDIALYMQIKEDLLNRARTVISKELKNKSVMEDLDTIPVDSAKIEVHQILKKVYNDCFKILDENEKLLKSKALENILSELDTNEEDIVGSIKFYNDTVVEYNQLVVSFPSNCVALIKCYKKKDFYVNDYRDEAKLLQMKKKEKEK